MAHRQYHSRNSQGQMQAGCRGHSSIAGSTLQVCGTGAQGLEQTTEITGTAGMGAGCRPSGVVILESNLYVPLCYNTR